VKRLAVALLIASACGVDTGGSQTLVELDGDAYARDVHPILEARCATLDCHGVDDRPLRLYAETGLRVRDDLRDQPIDPAELAANLRAIQAIDPGAAPADSLFIRKPAGPLFHEGGALFTASDDPQLVCVLAWLSGTRDAEACAVAADQVALPPPD
jgi:hypothetical protein